MGVQALHPFPLPHASWRCMCHTSLPVHHVSWPRVAFASPPPHRNRTGGGEGPWVGPPKPLQLRLPTGGWWGPPVRGTSPRHPPTACRDPLSPPPVPHPGWGGAARACGTSPRRPMLHYTGSAGRQESGGAPHCPERPHFTTRHGSPRSTAIDHIFATGPIASHTHHVLPCHTCHAMVLAQVTLHHRSCDAHSWRLFRWRLATVEDMDSLSAALDLAARGYVSRAAVLSSTSITSATRTVLRLPSPPLEPFHGILPHPGATLTTREERLAEVTAQSRSQTANRHVSVDHAFFAARCTPDPWLLGVTSCPPSRTPYTRDLTIFYISTLSMLFDVCDQSCWQSCMTPVEIRVDVLALCIPVF